MKRLPLGNICPLDDLRFATPSKKMVEHLYKIHYEELINQILMTYPDHYPLCVVPHCVEYIGYDDKDRLRHLEGHTRGLVTAWLEAKLIGSFTVKNPTQIKERLDKKKGALDEFFWR